MQSVFAQINLWLHGVGKSNYFSFKVTPNEFFRIFNFAELACFNNKAVKKKLNAIIVCAAEGFISKLLGKMY